MWNKETKSVATKLVIDGNAVYEIDEACQKGGREFWANCRRGAKNPCVRDNERLDNRQRAK
jgi:hypothetical protein